MHQQNIIHKEVINILTLYYIVVKINKLYIPTQSIPNFY